MTGFSRIHRGIRLLPVACLIGVVVGVSPERQPNRFPRASRTQILHWATPLCWCSASCSMAHGAAASLPANAAWVYRSMLSGMVLFPRPGNRPFGIAMAAWWGSLRRLGGGGGGISALAGYLWRGCIRVGSYRDVAFYAASGLRHGGSCADMVKLRLSFLFGPHYGGLHAVPLERMNYATGLYNLARNIWGRQFRIAATTTILWLPAPAPSNPQSVLFPTYTVRSAYRDSLVKPEGAPGRRFVNPPTRFGQAQGVI